MKKLEALIKAVSEVHRTDQHVPQVSIVWQHKISLWQVMIVVNPPVKVIGCEHPDLGIAISLVTQQFLESVGRGSAVDALCKSEPNEDEFLGIRDES